MYSAQMSGAMDTQMSNSTVTQTRGGKQATDTRTQVVTTQWRKLERDDACPGPEGWRRHEQDRVLDEGTAGGRAKWACVEKRVTLDIQRG